MSIVFVVYFMFGTAFTFGFQIKPHDGYYGILTDAYWNGQLHLRIQPDPHLLKLKAPYDPKLTKPYRMHDATLHDGKYYLYWGPVPVILRTLTLDLMSQVFYTFVYIYGCAFASLLILRHIKRRFFPEKSDWYVVMAFIFMAFNGPVFHLLGTDAIYYESIAAGQFFFLTGLLFYLKSLSAKEKKGHSYWLLTASIFLALSIGSRISFSFPAFLIWGYELFRVKAYMFLETWDPKMFKKSFAISGPLMFIFLFLGWYNWQRFGNPFDFGLYEQLIGFLPPPEYSARMLKNLPNNVLNYFFGLPSFAIHTPYVYTDFKTFPMVERTVFSMAIISPLITLIFFPFKLKTGARKLFWFLIGIEVMIMFQILYFMYFATTRYMFDMIFYLNLAGAVKFFASSSKWIRVYVLATLPLVFFICIGFWFWAIGEYFPVQYVRFNQFMYKISGNNKAFVNPNIPDEILKYGFQEKIQ
jgi:hypothetical protein